MFAKHKNGIDAQLAYHLEASTIGGHSWRQQVDQHDNTLHQFAQLMYDIATLVIAGSDALDRETASQYQKIQLKNSG